MKQIITRSKCVKPLWLMATLAMLMSLQATAEDYTRNFTKKFDVDKNATLLIDNQFGEVHCENWDQQAISIDVIVTVGASSQEKANKVFDKITIELKGDRTKVQGLTSMGSMNMDNVQFSIDYSIRMPRSINVDLTCRFGDMFIDAVEGNSKIRMEYGDLEAKSISGGSNKLILKFGDARIQYLKLGNISLEYAELDLDGAGNLDITSRFSELGVEAMEDLNLDSQYDQIVIDKAGAAKVISRFSDIELGSVTKDLSLDVQYGEIEANYIGAGFKTGKVDNAFASVLLVFDPAVSINVEAEMKFGKLRYPKELSSLSYSDQGFTTSTYKGVIGKGSAKATLVIEAANGDVTVQYK